MQARLHASCSAQVRCKQLQAAPTALFRTDDRCAGPLRRHVAALQPSPRALPSIRVVHLQPPRATHSHAQQPSREPRSEQPDALNAEIISIALPMLATLAADPIAGLVDAAYIGRLGPVELAGVGVALSMFNTVSKLFNMPLLAVTTSAVASASGRSQKEGRAEAVAAAMSSALLIAVIVGLCQAALLAVNASWAAGLWGVGSASPLRNAVTDFLMVRAIGAPITTLLLVLQGVYRGLQDTRTPFYATLAASVLNIILNPILIFGCGLGVKGAAIGTVVAQALPCTLLLWRLASSYQLKLDPLALRQVVQLFGPTFYSLLRTMAITLTYALATSLVTRAGPSAAACHQVCFQVWLASSLLADSLAVASQTLLARSIAAGEYEYARKVVDRTVAMAGGLGLALMALLALGKEQLPRLFTQDPQVLALFGWVLPFVVLTQPVNSLAFLWDGVLFGAGGFRYASIQMALCAAPAVAVMYFGNQLAAAGAAAAPPAAVTLMWVWAGLATVMAGRAASIYLPYKLRLPPFRVLWRDQMGAAAPQHGGQ